MKFEQQGAQSRVRNISSWAQPSVSSRGPFAFIRGFLVPAQLGGLGESLAAPGTFERLLPRVRANVIIQSRGPRKRPAAVTALERLFVHVNHHVFAKLARLLKGRRAVATLVRLVRLLGADVHLKENPLGESL